MVLADKGQTFCKLFLKQNCSGMDKDVLFLALFLRTHTLSITSQEPGHHLPRQNEDHDHHDYDLIISSVLPFEYGDPNWRVAIKLIYRTMVQESRHNLNIMILFCSPVGTKSPAPSIIALIFCKLR